ncbi:MAG TPA: hypothetical protein VLY46_00655 [Usitatibacter sp.]|nr:hypothetical protein [Usitatibacter sp.]
MAGRPEYRIVLVERPAWLHAVATGDNVAENARRFLREAYEACVSRGRDCLLLEMSFSGESLPTATIFEIVTERSADGARLRRIAYVDRRLGHDPAKALFAETVAVNRAVNVRLFHDVADAERWLAQP